MTYEIRFKERGYAWYTYRGLIQRYKRIDENMMSGIKINKSTITIHDDKLLSDLERIAKKAKAKYGIKQIF